MKERLQNNYKNIVLNAFVAIAVFFVLVTGILAIKNVQSVELKEYQVHGQHEAVFEAGYNKVLDSHIYQFQCVGKDMKALLVQGNVWELSTGIIWYRIEDAQENVLIETVVDIPSTFHPGYEGIWIDVSELNLIQGENYKLTINVNGAYGVLITYEDFKITVAQIFAYNYALFYTVIIIAIMILAFVWLYVVYKKGYGIKLYFFTSMVLGVLIVCLMPPANQDDEYRHFLRAYMDVKEIQAQFRQPTGIESGIIKDRQYGEYFLDVPYEINELRLMGYRDNYNGFEYRTEVNQFLCIDKMVAMLKTQPIESEYRVSVAGVSYKNNTSYWPQNISMKLVDMFGVRDFVLYYAARFGQLLVCIVMEMMAMKLAPKMKEMIWLLAFVPNTFILKASCNPDGLMTAEILLSTAIVIWMKEEKIDFLSKKGIWGTVAYAMLTLNILMMKFPYILISLGLLVYLEKENVEKAWTWINNHKKQSVTIAGGVMVLVCVGLLLMKDVVLTFVYTILPQTHITYIAAHPVEIAKLFIEKWGFMCINVLYGMNGEFFVPYVIFVFSILVMLKKQLPMRKRIWFGTLFGILIMVIVLAGYSLSPADHGTIEGIGYRYLLPFLVVGAIALPSGNEKTQKIAKQLMPLAVFVTTTTTMITWIVGWSV